MTPIEEMLKISQNLEQILENQYGAVGRGLREKVDSVAGQLPEDTVRKIGKLAAMRNKATHENIALANEQIAAFRQIAGEVMVSLMLKQPLGGTQTVTKSGGCDSTPKFSSQESGPLYQEEKKFTWEGFYYDLLPDAKQYMRQLQLHDELLNNYSPTHQKVRETESEMRLAIKRLSEFYTKTLHQRQQDLQTMIKGGCHSDAPVVIAVQKTIDKLKREMAQLQQDNTIQDVLQTILEWLQPGDRKDLECCGIVYSFCWCPPGEFMMGSNNGNDSENPAHKVTLTQGFWLLQTPVTQAMWQSMMGENPSYFRGGLKPVDNVSWEDCQEFCEELSYKLGKEVQLPTEAQWEYACRAGTIGDYAGNLNEMAWYDNNSGNKTHKVALKESNDWGLYDMHGNVDEWCADYYDEHYYSRSPTSDPENTTFSSYHVNRGGGYCSTAWNCRSTNRWKCVSGGRFSDLGLRILLVPDKEDMARSTVQDPEITFMDVLRDIRDIFWPKKPPKENK